MSVSIGCSAIFLLGNGDRDDICHEMILEHGDVLIMDGEDRKSLHAVPRVLTSDQRPVDLQIGNNIIKNYLGQARLNINIRQVN